MSAKYYYYNYSPGRLFHRLIDFTVKKYFLIVSLNFPFDQFHSFAHSYTSLAHPEQFLGINVPPLNLYRQFACMLLVCLCDLLRSCFINPPDA